MDFRSIIARMTGRRPIAELHSPLGEWDHAQPRTENGMWLPRRLRCRGTGATLGGIRRRGTLPDRRRRGGGRPRRPVRGTWRGMSRFAFVRRESDVRGGGRGCHRSAACAV